MRSAGGRGVDVVLNSDRGFGHRIPYNWEYHIHLRPIQVFGGMRSHWRSQRSFARLVLSLFTDDDDDDHDDDLEEEHGETPICYHDKV